MIWFEIILESLYDKVIRSSRRFKIKTYRMFLKFFNKILSSVARIVQKKIMQGVFHWKKLNNAKTA